MSLVDYVEMTVVFVLMGFSMFTLIGFMVWCLRQAFKLLKDIIK